MEENEIVRRERERKVVEIVRNFLLATLTIRQQYEKYQKDVLRFSDLTKLVDDRGRSILFALKERCQDVYRRPSGPISEKEQIFDLTVGSLFHLAMKMREDLYQLEFYGPKYLELNSQKDGPQGKKHLIHQFREILGRAETSFKEGMEEIYTLSQDIFGHFQDLLREYRENGLLMRFFLEEKDLVRRVLGASEGEDILRTIYGEGEASAYGLAGESYFQSAFYAKAFKAFSRAREKKPGDETLQFKVHLSQGMDQFFSYAPLQALKSLEKCLALSEKVKFIEAYRDMIRKVCLAIQEESPRRRKSDQHRDLVKKAQVLQRHLEALAPVPSNP